LGLEVQNHDGALASIGNTPQIIASFNPFDLVSVSLAGWRLTSPVIQQSWYRYWIYGHWHVL